MEIEILWTNETERENAWHETIHRLTKGKRLPLGLFPFHLWVESVDFDPELFQLVDRYKLVIEAIARYRAAGLPPNPKWLEEAGLLN